MTGFLRIHSFFENSEGRTIANLSSIYNEEAKLVEAIESLINGILTKELIYGRSVLLKPNWVKHSAVPSDEICLRTNDNFILAVLKVVLKMCPSRVIIGDAPIQGCNWDRMVSAVLIKRVASLSEEFKVPVSIKDFRRRNYNISDNAPASEIKPSSDYVLFDLEKKSRLEPVTSSGKTKFRVTNYNSDRMSEAHAPGMHKYCITKEFFDADIVLSLPKVKTHQKTGITGAIKNIVGINGDKDFLPHHRLGGTSMGGDCYPGGGWGSYLRYWSEITLDSANHNQGRKRFWFWLYLSSFLWKISLPSSEHQRAAGWHGNDTTWRMVIDINTIARFGKSDGTVSEKPQRQIFSLCDGIIAGQGDGPLEPEPLPMGYISFSNDSSLNDWAYAILMGLEPERLSLLRNSFNSENINEIFFNCLKLDLSELGKHSIITKLPKGWRNYKLK